MRRIRQAIVALALAAAVAGPAAAHEIPAHVNVRLLLEPEGDRLQALVRVPLRAMRDAEFPAQASGYLDVEALAQQLPVLAETWIAPFVEIDEAGRPLGLPRVVETQISMPSDRAFETFDGALARVRAPLPANAENLSWEQVYLDALLEYPIEDERSRFALRSGLEHLGLRVATAVEFRTPGGDVRSYQLLGGEGRLPLDPSWGQAAWRFLGLGFTHILEGPDHLLFVLCLVIPFRRAGPLVWIVTAFTIAHSLTLSASALGWAPTALWFPPLVETLIAASILYMAIENIVGASSKRRRWLLAFGFGLVHGFGFAFALRETLQLGGSRVATSLAAFNVGVEAGQLLALAVLVPLLNALFRYVVAERMGAIILSAFVAHTSWHWLAERWDVFRRYEVGWTATAPVAGVVAVAGLAAWAFWRSRRGARSEAQAP